MVFISGDFINGQGEAGRGRRAGGLLNLPAKAAGQGMKLRGGQFAHIALGERVFDLAQLFAQNLGPIADRTEPLFTERFQFDDPEVLDRELVFAAPRDKGGLGHIQFGYEARITPALSAQFDETLNGIVVVHTVLSSRVFSPT